MFKPNFTITPEIATTLMKIEALKESIKNLPLTPLLVKTLCDAARLQSVHYSTQIEGNRLSQKEVEQVIRGVGHFSGRQGDELEIKGYHLALEWLEGNISKPVSETTIKKIHALVEGEGKSRAKPTPYRIGQNVVKDSASGVIIYMPPEWRDVPALMKDLVKWLITERANLPTPILAAIAHYQFVTIHPYYDGNGRTARLLTTLVLCQGDYDLKGLYSLEEYYARDLQGYYNAISRGGHHNYYFGRAEADITPWIEYFVSGMLDAFTNAQKRAGEAVALLRKTHGPQNILSDKRSEDKRAILRTLSPRQREVLALFVEKAVITSKDVESLFGFSIRASRFLLKNMVNQGFLEIANSSDKARTYKLAPEYESLIL